MRKSILFVLVLSLIFSCEEEDNLKTNCRLSTMRNEIIDGNTYGIDYFYDNENRVSKIEFLGSGVDSFIYNENKIIMYVGIGDIETITLNENNYPVKLERQSPHDGNRTHEYIYNSDNTVKELRVDYESNFMEDVIYKYEYLNGNLVNIYRENELLKTYEYTTLENVHGINLGNDSQVPKRKVSKCFPEKIIYWSNDILDNDLEIKKSSKNWYKVSDYSYDINYQDGIIKIYGVHTYSDKVVETEKIYTLDCL